MSTALERSYERTVRVQAPLRGLYREMDSVPGMVRFISEIAGHVAGESDGQAVIIGSVSIGPLSYRLDGTLAVERVNPPNSLTVQIRAEGLHLELDGTFEFTVAAAEETTVRYAATIRSGHPLVRRMRSALTGALEEHVDSATDLVVMRGRQYAAAERKLAHPERHGGN